MKISTPGIDDERFLSTCSCSGLNSVDGESLLNRFLYIYNTKKGVTKHEFIFSNQRQHRVARHVVFWIVWWLTYTLLFHVPTLELKGWGFSKEAAPATFSDVAKIGPALFSIKTLIFNSLLATVVPQAIFTYVLIYWILPQRFYKKKNAFVTVII
jgi:hypothetical protein